LQARKQHHLLRRLARTEGLNGMPGRASSLIAIPGSFWERAETRSALRRREIGPLFQLLRQYAGASQTQIGIACGMTRARSATSCVVSRGWRR
jgi:hypothetical protein